MKKYLVLIVVSIMLVATFSGIAYAGTGSEIFDKQNVIVFHSYHQGLQWTNEIQDGIAKKLSPSAVELYVEYMDSYRIIDSDMEAYIYETYRKKYGNMNISCIVVVDNYAFNFMSQYYEELFEGIPIVFVGINNLSEDMLFSNNMTGIGETSYQIEYIQLIRQFHPEVNQIVVAGSYSDTSIAESTALIDFGQENFEDIRFTATLDDNLEGLLRQLNNYDSHSAIIVAGTIVTEDRSFINHVELASIIREETQLPVYGSSTVYVGDNSAIGAYGSTPYIQGSLCGDCVRRILAGEEAQDIPVNYNPTGQYVFDYNLLNQYKIDIKELPEDSVVLNSPSNQIVIDEKVSIAFIAILFGLIAVIIILVVNTRKRKKAELRLLESQKEVVDKNFKLEKSYNQLSVKQKKLSEQYIELRNKNKEIKFLLYYDSLTKLYKRDRLVYEINNLISFNEDNTIVVYAIDVAVISILDDTYGHVIGDLVRKKVADIITEAFPRNHYLTGRHHDNYFVVDHDSESNSSINKNLKTLQYAIDKTIYIKGIEIELKGKIGLVQYGRGNSGDDLIKMADIAVVEANKRENETVVVYREEFLTSIKQRLVIEKDIKKALLNHEFELYFQPQIDAYTEVIKGCEALIRWNREDSSITYPGSFINVAEETGLITQIGNWVIEEACQRIKIWKSKGINCPISINVSAKQVDATLVNTLENALQKYQIDPKMLIVEITETVFMDIIEYKKKVLNDIDQLGIHISLDDFGTGYSSLNYIKEFPIKKLKIDKGFIDNIHEERQQVITKAIVMLGKELGNDTIAEGVETKEQLEVLKTIGVSAIQGWYYSKAIKVEAFEAYYKEKNMRWEEGNV